MCIDDYFPGPFPWFNSIEYQKDKDPQVLEISKETDR
jgi:hypothetical protein